MSARQHGSSLVRQLVTPVVLLVLVAVLANMAFAAWLAARRSVAAARTVQEQVAATLDASRVSLSQPVLDALSRLTGSHFVVWNMATGTAGFSTLPADTPATEVGAATTKSVGDVATIAGRSYRIGRARSGSIRPETVLVLTPVEALARTTFDAIWPVLAVAAATLAVLVPLGLRTTGRLATRIGAVERHVGRIAAGEFGHTLAAHGTDDEIGRLVGGVNRMSTTLDTLRATLVAGERQRLLGQLAAGFAHELRNAITGARLAIDLHRRRCGTARTAGGGPDESLDVAVRQLDILEEEVRGLLALGRPPATEPVPLEIDPLYGEVRDLTGPRCAHAGVQFECERESGVSVVGRRDALRAALVNLVLNAIDAAGRGGNVRLFVREADGQTSLVVEDDGPGPPQHLRDTLHEPFVTGKPEWIGLGLAVAKAVAEEHGGRLDWSAAEGRTRFAIRLPSRRLDRPPVEPRGALTEGMS